ncbi:MAG: hypothetical protein MMC33_006591 [Icmadophila ericetorum]|nr:hypothetical protein [Icmadophila ericetorum]
MVVFVFFRAGQSKARIPVAGKALGAEEDLVDKDDVGGVREADTAGMGSEDNMDKDVEDVRVPVDWGDTITWVTVV